MWKSTSTLAIALAATSFAVIAGGSDYPARADKAAPAAAPMRVAPRAATPNYEIVYGEMGHRFFDRPSSRSRAEVAAEAREAVRLGQIAYGEVGAGFADAPSTLSRAQVVAETLEARRLGLIAYGEVGPRPATPAEQAQIARAGREAAMRHAEATRVGQR